MTSCAAFRLKTNFALLVVHLIIAVPALPQTTTSLVGRIGDASGAVIEHADVVLISIDDASRREEVSDGQGDYQFRQLKPGKYSLTVTAQGFATFTKENIELLVASPATLNVTLQVGHTLQVETVSSIQPMLNAADATLGNVFTSEQIPELPLEGRDVLLLLSLQPGVSYLGPQTGNSLNDSRSGAVNGARSDQSNVTLDGIGVNDENYGYSFDSVLGVTQESVAEFRVTTSNAGADAGRSSGGEIAMITRSGTNQFHGAAYEFNRTTPFSANDWFNKENQLANALPNRATELIRNVFGVAVGGPLLKNRIFFFTNYEGTRAAQSASSPEIEMVPSVALRQGIVQYTDVNGNLVQLTPAQIQGMDPQGVGINPAALQVLGSYPLPNSNLAGDGLNFSGFQFVTPQHSSFDTYIARLDWNVTQKHSVFWRGNLVDDDQPSPPQFPSQPPASSVLTNSKGYAVGYTAILRPNLVNDIRFGLTRQGSSNSGISNQPQITLAGLESPTAYTRSSSFIIPVNNLVDNMSWTEGVHSLQFGTNLRFIDDQQISTQNSYPSASGVIGWLHPGTIAGGDVPLDPEYSGYPTVSNNSQSYYNDAISDVVGLLTQGNAIYNYTKTGTALALGAPVKRDYRWHELEFYGQDSWKTSANLTLTFGLRYSYQRVPAETSGAQVGPCVVSGSVCSPYSLTKYLEVSAMQGAIGGAASNLPDLSFAPDGRYNGKPDFWTPDKADFSPRLAFAYAPHASEGFWKTIFGDSSSIRGGYSLIFDHFGAGVVNAYNESGSFGLTDQVENPPGQLTTTTAPRFESLTQFPAGLLPAAPPGIFPATPNPSGFAISYSLDSSIHTPYSNLFDFSIQRQLNASNLLEVAYVGRFAHRLLEQEDVAAPLNLVVNGQSYYDAATQLSMLARQKTPAAAVPQIAYWQTLFGALQGVNTGFGPLSATQNVYQQFLLNVLDETSALNVLDEPNGGLGAGTLYPAYRFFHSQYSSLYGYRSIGQSYYNGLQIIFHHRASHGLQADFNYTYSRAIDWTSQAERLGNGGLFNLAHIVNTWEPGQLRGVSDFNMTHQINSNYVWDIPVGRGREFYSSAGRLVDAAIGGWQFTGIVRWTSGLPFGVANGPNFPTNWNIAGFATLDQPIPSSALARGQGNQRFADPAAVVSSFESAFPGQSGSRNPLLGEGYFGWDAGLNKFFSLTERVKMQLRWEVFNVTNSVRFDPQSISANYGRQALFGEATAELTTPRDMQIAARISF
ncbi:MAG: TonB-dependent receptor [Candidatus Sulfotelmatobacter sp.]